MTGNPVDRVHCLQLVLTARCNLRCTYCFQNLRRRGRMDGRILRRATDLLLESRRPEGEVVFYGGEPLLEFPRIRETVRYVEGSAPPGKKIRFSLSTNGTLLDDRIAAFLSEHRVRTQISFDGVPAVQRFRGGGTFARLDPLLDRLARRHPVFFLEDVEVAITPVVRALPHLARSVRYFLEKGVATIHIAPPSSHDPAWTRGADREIRRQLARIREVSARHFRAEGTIPVALLRKHRTTPTRAPRGAPICDGAAGERIAVDVDGQAYGCAAFAESYQIFPPGMLRDALRTMRLGDLRDRSFRRRLARYPDAVRATRIFHAKEAKRSLHGRCGTCPFVASCTICPVGTGFIPGNHDPHRIPDYSCAFNHAAFRSQEKMPRLPDVGDVLTGNVPVPERVREFEEFLFLAQGSG